MGIFSNILGADESLFKNEIALSFDYIPKEVPYREYQKQYIASCIKPLFQKRNGKSLLVFGPPGIGKTVAIKHLFQEIEYETDDIFVIYVNCWQKNSTYKIFVDLCEQLGYKFTQNKKTEELFKIIKQILNKKSVVFAFDEVDKLEDFDFLYTILEEVYRKTIILITNYHQWLIDLDERVKSRLMPETVEFNSYNKEETSGILKQRVNYAFVPDVIEDSAFRLISDKAFERKDIRTGIYLLKEAGTAAEDSASRKITKENAETAIRKLTDFSIKQSSELEDSTRTVLSIIRENSGSKIGDLFKTYQDKGGLLTYKTFQRKIKKLSDNNFIKVTKTEGGDMGNTTIVTISDKADEKKLTDF
ncbi:MAG: AAA family ATPase [Candidatus Woesearchaeota archaeon]